MEMNNMGGQGSHSNGAEPSRRQENGFYLSTSMAFVLILLSIILAAGVGFMVYFFTAKQIVCNCQYPKQTGTPLVPTRSPTLSPSAMWERCISLAKSRKDCLPIPDITCTTLAPSTTTTLAPSTTTTLAPSTTTSTSRTTSMGSTVKPLIKDVRLSSDIIPHKYTLQLAPDIYGNDKDQMFFTGSLKIRVSCKEQTNTFALHSMGLNYTKVILRALNSSIVKELDRAPYDVDREWTRFTLKKGNFQPGQSYEIKIPSFRGPLKNDMRGLYLSSYRVANKTEYIATSQCQPTDARKVFPCFDEPKFKANFDIVIKKKVGYTALSNMKATNTSAADKDGWQSVSFGTTLSMSTYLLAFQVHKFAKLELLDTKNRTFRVWARPSVIHTANYSNHAGVAITNYFEKYFNTSYPLQKTDQSAVTDFNAGAMENWGLIIYRESAMLWSRVIGTASQRQRVATVVSHELAHQWFGNLVTPEWWDDIWLNEGFASFVELLGVDAIHPDWRMDEQFLLTDMHNVMVMDSYGSSHPIYMTVFNPNQINSIFDRITYNKGASILRMLHSFLGNELFGKAIGVYLQRNQYNVTQYPQLWSTLTEEAMAAGKNMNISNIMNTWILQMGYPVVNVTRGNNNLILHQEHFLADDTQKPDPKYPNPFNYTWHIPITWTSASTCHERNKMTTNVTWFYQKKDELAVKIPSSDWFILNVQQKGFYRVNYEESNWNKIIQQLQSNHSVIDVRNRAQLIEDSFRLASANHLKFEIPLDLTKYLVKETEYVPWTVMIKNFAYITQMFNQDVYYGDFTKYMQGQLKSIYQKVNGWQQNADDDHLTKLLRSRVVTAACTFNLPECVTEAKLMFQNWMKNASTSSIPPDLRRTAFCVGVSSGDINEFNVVFDRFTKEDIIDIKVSLMYALSCSRSPWILKTLLRYSIDDNKIRRQDSVTVINNVANTASIGRDMAWNFIREEWKTLSDRFKGAFSLKNLIIRSLQYMNTERQIKEIEAFKNLHGDSLGSGALAIEEVLASVRSNVAWMDKFRTKIGEWFRTANAATTAGNA